MILFERVYSDESLGQDASNDINDLFDTLEYDELPEAEEDWFKRGTFKVTVEWVDDYE